MTSDSDSNPSIWHYKPWWCQPWSILLTGLGLIGGSWLLFHTLWLTGIISLPIVAWMIIFLVIYPRQFKVWLKTAPPHPPVQSE